MKKKLLQVGAYYHDNLWPADDQSCQVLVNDFPGGLTELLKQLENLLNAYRNATSESQKDWREVTMPEQFRAYHSLILRASRGTGIVSGYRPTEDEWVLMLLVLGNIFILTQEGFLKDDNHNGMNYVWEQS